MKFILSVSNIVAKLGVENARARQITIRGGDEEGVAFLKERKISKGRSMLLTAVTKSGTEVKFVQRDTHAIWGVHQPEGEQFAALYGKLAEKPGVAVLALSDVSYEGYVPAAAETVQEVEF